MGARSEGDKAGRYAVEGLLGEGSMGQVHRAHDGVLGRTVALKMLLRETDGADPVLVARLLREARAAAAIVHPNVVTILDVGELDGLPFVAMEVVSGRALRAFIGDPSVTVATKLEWLAALARGLAAGHERGLVHRDVKPDNVMVGDDGTLKLLDYGIACPRDPARDAGLRRTGVTGTGAAKTARTRRVHPMAGTPLYMAPEQITGEDLDGRADQFAWGVVAHELLAGRVPWKSTHAVALLAEIIRRSPARLSVAGVPSEVPRIVERALFRDPADRYPTMNALLDELVPASALP